MRLYTIQRIDAEKVEHYFPRESFTLDDWTAKPEEEVWNTSLIAIALHHANVMRERERLLSLGSDKPPRKIIIVAAVKHKDSVMSWAVDETQYSYAGVI